MNPHIKLFDRFLKDDEAWEFFITGVAGTGKTTSLDEFVRYALELGYTVTICAYTHKACNVLRSKISAPAEIKTLHSYLKKRPGINQNATKVQNIEVSMQTDAPERVSLLFIDEFSMIGEADLMSLRELQDADYDGQPTVKIVFIGDPFQLPPVKDMEAIIPDEPYWVRLTEQKRRKKGSPLGIPIDELISFLEGRKEPHPLTRNEAFYQVANLAEEYKANKGKEDSLFLAYTNKTVQAMNFSIQGRDFPIEGDVLFSSTAQRFFTFQEEIPRERVTFVDRLWDDPLTFDSKYKTLEFMLTLDCCKFLRVEDEEGIPYIYPAVFGTYNHKLTRESFGKEATQANSEIEAKFKDQKAAAWAQANYTHPLARARSLAWRKYLTFKDLLCFDFEHAMTIHKSQGTTVDTVYLDVEDLYLCADSNFNMYLRLYYVGMSRARHTVKTN
jgi:ATP-dependent exoDNAse (exonuclease V) alpha subunit